MVYSCKDKECVICGKFYLPTGRSQKTCSDECCKEQTATRKAKHYQENKGQISGQQKQYRQANPKKIATREAKHYQENKEQINKRAKQHRQANPKKIATRRAKHYQANSERICEEVRSRRITAKEKGMAGLYGLRNIVTKWLYIGQSTFVEQREREHFSALRSKIDHSNKLLQKDYDKYGADAFEFAMVKEINKEDFQSEKELKDYLLEEEVLHSARAVNEGKVLYNEDPAIYALARVLQERLDKD